MILELYGGAAPEMLAAGREWYPNARAICERIGGDAVPVDTVARVMAALSPRCHWKVNVRQTEEMIAAFLAGQDVPAVSTGTNRMRAWSELNGTPALSGPKTTAFARAILGDEDAVVIDSWIMRSVGLAPTAKLTRHRLRWITEAYTDAARAVGETPRNLQAIVWCAIRGGSA